MKEWEKRMGLGGFDSIIKIQKQFQTSINPLLKYPQIQGNFAGINRIQEITKGFKQQIMFSQPNSVFNDAILKSLSWQTKLGIPQTTIDSINSINKQYEQVFGSLKKTIDSVKFQSPAIAQINNLNFALNSISNQIAFATVKHRDWSIFEDFENVIDQTLEFTETLDEELDKEQEQQFQILLSLVLSFLNKHKALGVSALLIMDIFLRFAGFHQYHDFLEEKPKLPTKEEVNQIGIKQDSTIFFIQKITEKLKEAKEYRITNRLCEVKLKPRMKTIILTKLTVGFDVVVIQIHHKWVYVSYFDPRDNLPQTGWIMKKYLNKPK